MVPQPLEFAAQPIRLRQWTKDMPMPTRVLRGLVAALPLFLAACSGSAPSSEEIARLLAERGFDKPACASSTLFKTFPVTLSDSFSGPGPAKGNAAVYDALVGVGLLRRDGDSYDLTPAGREDYKPESKAFCYSSGFDVSVRSVDPAKPDDYGPAVEKGWLVTVEVKPREVKDWAKNPEVLKQASLTTLQQITQPQVGQVSLVKPRGEEGYKLVNTRFSPRQGFHFNQAW